MMAALVAIWACFRATRMAKPGHTGDHGGDQAIETTKPTGNSWCRTSSTHARGGVLKRSTLNRLLGSSGAILSKGVFGRVVLSSIVLTLFLFFRKIPPRSTRLDRGSRKNTPTPSFWMWWPQTPCKFVESSSTWLVNLSMMVNLPEDHVILTHIASRKHKNRSGHGPEHWRAEEQVWVTS